MLYQSWAPDGNHRTWCAAKADELMFHLMSITLKVDDDVAALPERLRKKRCASLSELVNEALRKGLQEIVAGPKQQAQFHTRVVDPGRLRIGSIDNIAGVLAIAEGEAFDRF